MSNESEKPTVMIPYLEFEKYRALFHATRADSDGAGNKFETFYAKVTAVQQIVQQLTEEASRLTDVSNLSHAQGEHIANATEIANEGLNKAENAKTQAENVADEQVVANEKLAELTHALSLIEAEVKDLQENSSAIIANDKGVYLSEATLNAKVPEPSDGDSASVAFPYYVEGEDFSPAEFFGDNFIGDKDEHPEWVDNTEEINHVYYTHNDVIYEVIKPTSRQYISDAEHHAQDSELVEEGYVAVVTPIRVSTEAQVPFILYVAEGGKWEKTHIIREFTSSSIVKAKDVLDGDKNQQKINSVNEINAQLVNVNAGEIQNVVNTIIKNFVTLAEKVCVTAPVEIEPMQHLSLAKVTVDGDGSNTRLGLCTLPMTLIETKYN